MREFLRDENGQGMVEYALIIALVSIVAMAILFTLGGTISNKFSEVNNKLTNPSGGSGSAS